MGPGRKSKSMNFRATMLQYSLILEHAKANNLTISKVLELAIDEYLNKHQNSKKENELAFIEKAVVDINSKLNLFIKPEGKQATLPPPILIICTEVKDAQLMFDWFRHFAVVVEDINKIHKIVDQLAKQYSLRFAVICRTSEVAAIANFKKVKVFCPQLAAQEKASGLDAYYELTETRGKFAIMNELKEKLV